MELSQNINPVGMGLPQRPGPMDRALFERRDGTGDMRRDFASVLGREGIKGTEGESPEERARRGAENFVAIALVQPLLKQLRATNHAAPPFAPTSGEKQFQEIADAELAQRMVRASRFPLVDRLAQDLLKKAAGQAKTGVAKVSKAGGA